MKTYTTILNIEIKHSKYSSGLCTDLSFSPTPETQNLIDGHRLLVKYKPAGLVMYAPLDGAENLLIPIEKGLKLRWLLKVRSSTFYDITSLPIKDWKGHYSISNSKQEEASNTPFELSLDSLVKQFTSTHELQKNKNIQKITLKRSTVFNAKDQDVSLKKTMDGNSTALSSLKWKLNDDRTSLQITGTLKENTGVEAIYPIPAKGGQNVFAVLEIELLKAFTKKKDEELSYTLSLEAK